MVFVSIPFELLVEKYLSQVVEHRVNVEIVLKAEALERFFFTEF